MLCPRCLGRISLNWDTFFFLIKVNIGWSRSKQLLTTVVVNISYKIYNILFYRLREVSDKLNRFGFATHRIFEQLKIPVKEIAIGPSHIGILLEDGKVFRAAFSINPDRIDLSRIDNNKKWVALKYVKYFINDVTSYSNTNNSPNVSTGSKNVASSSRQLARSRARLMRTTARSGSGNQSTGSRSTGVIIGNGSSSRPIVTVPATYVPEELISQAEVVLQGKSRNLIIRELQVCVSINKIVDSKWNNTVGISED